MVVEICRSEGVTRYEHYDKHPTIRMLGESTHPSSLVLFEMMLLDLLISRLNDRPISHVS